MKILPVYTLCVIHSTLISYRSGALYIHTFEGTILGKGELLCKIPMSAKMRIVSCLPVLKRIFRTMPRAVKQVSDTAFVFAYLGKIFRVDIREKTILCEHTFPEPMRAPIAFSEICGVPGFEDCLVYGEYHGNLGEREMGVYARSADGVWTRRYTFPAGTICHIHGFCPDPAHGRVLILTGDRDEQSGFYAASENFTRVEPLLCGSQHYRSCVAFSYKNDILYATDTPLEQNALYRFGADCVPEKIYEMPGPCIFGITMNDTYFFATSVEPDSRLTRWRYMLTYRLGQGVKERYTHIVAGNPDRGFRTVLRLKKDWLPMLLCQFGNAAFVSVGEDMLIVPQSISRFEGKTICLERANENVYI